MRRGRAAVAWVIVSCAAGAGFGQVAHGAEAGLKAVHGDSDIAFIETYGAFVSGGVDVRLADGAPEGVTGELWVRRSGEQAFRAGHRLVRYDGNHMASSLFSLVPGAAYEVKVCLTRPGGLRSEGVAALVTRPEWALPAAAGTHGVSSGAELAAALRDARPGDHIVLAGGDYPEHVYVFDKDGTPAHATADGRIVIRSADPEHPARLLNGIALHMSSYFTLYGLEIRHGGPDGLAGVNVRGSARIEIVDCRIADPPEGSTAAWAAIFIQHLDEIRHADRTGGHLVLNNLIAEDDHVDAGPVAQGERQTYYGIKQDYLVGGFVTVRGNTIRGFADGISPGGDEGQPPVLGPGDEDLLSTWPNQNLDIHGNTLYDLTDDAVETDGHTVNGRIFENFIGAAANGISAAPVYPGPYFILRNTVYGFRESGLKMNTGVAGVTRNVFVYHNTFKQAEGASYLIYRGWPARTRDVVLRNNILDARGRVVDTDMGSNYPCEYFHTNHDFDADLLWSERAPGGSEVLFKWGYSNWPDNVRYNSLAAFQAGTADPGQTFDCPEQRVVPQEPNGVFADPRLEHRPFADMDGWVGELVPAEGSPAVDGAAPLPGINDAFAGEGPDVGAVETGSAPGPCSLACGASAPAGGYVDTAVEFTAASAASGACTGGVVNTWDFGDGSIQGGGGASAAHAYAAEGEYAWSMTAELGGASCVRTGSITVYAVWAPASQVPEGGCAAAGARSADRRRAWCVLAVFLPGFLALGKRGFRRCGLGGRQARCRGQGARRGGRGRRPRRALSGPRRGPRS